MSLLNIYNFIEYPQSSNKWILRIVHEIWYTCWTYWVFRQINKSFILYQLCSFLLYKTFNDFFLRKDDLLTIDWLERWYKISSLNKVIKSKATIPKQTSLPQRKNIAKVYCFIVYEQNPTNFFLCEHWFWMSFVVGNRSV